MSILRQPIYNDQNCNKALREGKMSDEIHRNLVPNVIREWDRVKEAVWGVGVIFDGLASGTFSDVVGDVAVNRGPIESSLNRAKVHWMPARPSWSVK